MAGRAGGFRALLCVKKVMQISDLSRQGERCEVSANVGSSPIVPCNDTHDVLRPPWCYPWLTAPDRS